MVIQAIAWLFVAFVLPICVVAAPQTLVSSQLDVDDSPLSINLTAIDSYQTRPGVVTCYSPNDIIFTPEPVDYTWEACEHAIYLLGNHLKSKAPMRWWWTESGNRPASIEEPAFQLPLMNQKEPKTCLLLMISTAQLSAVSTSQMGKASDIGWRPGWGNRPPAGQPSSFLVAREEIIMGFWEILGCLNTAHGKEGAGHKTLETWWTDPAAVSKLRSPLEPSVPSTRNNQHLVTNQTFLPPLVGCNGLDRMTITIASVGICKRPVMWKQLFPLPALADMTTTKTLLTLVPYLITLTYGSPISPNGSSLSTLEDDPDQPITVDCFKSTHDPAPTYHDCWEVADTILSYDKLGMVTFTDSLTGTTINTNTSSTEDAAPPTITADSGTTQKKSRDVGGPLNPQYTLYTPFYVVHESCRATITLQPPNKSFVASFAWIAKRTWMTLDDCVHGSAKRGGESKVGGGLDITMGYNHH
ncbi:uncharacterized protein KY384_007487 [Bacidia gigantensis]|uniref:uncharacterized protein n=1 Tax=Bacidia gigantensis TaxID=2732470 RepID=UPI001D0518FA|nr:uncharacterized protein KY384_007487 [Bacidia gigantensis]KAG8527335.1 hypothetical protein KY384_007487 [Bacidia gigantensis]